ncbi:hypothetical protein MITS9509_01352 [Synechococcus sp. MIT S9509]|nr:hypothetical protein MITS9509_01352 [Synechococcus sp. MIT S9509]
MGCLLRKGLYITRVCTRTPARASRACARLYACAPARRVCARAYRAPVFPTTARTGPSYLSAGMSQRVSAARGRAMSHVRSESPLQAPLRRVYTQSRQIVPVWSFKPLVSDSGGAEPCKPACVRALVA